MGNITRLTRPGYYNSYVASGKFAMDFEQKGALPMYLNSL